MSKDFCDITLKDAINILFFKLNEACASTEPTNWNPSSVLDFIGEMIKEYSKKPSYYIAQIWYEEYVSAFPKQVEKDLPF